jgi:hypothetical protein
MHCQVFAHKINILFQALLYLFNLYGFFRTTGHALRKLCILTYAIIAVRIKIGNKILENNPERAGYRAGFTARAEHLVALDMPVTGALQGVMITRIYARRFFTMPADSGKGRVFA